MAEYDAEHDYLKLNENVKRNLGHRSVLKYPSNKYPKYSITSMNIAMGPVTELLGVSS